MNHCSISINMLLNLDLRMELQHASVNSFKWTPWDRWGRQCVRQLNSTGATVALTGRRCNSWTTATFLQPWHWIVHICMFNCKWSCSEHGFLQMSLLLCVFCVNREGRTSFFWKYLHLLCVCVCVWPYLCVCFPSSSRGRSSVWPAASQGFISAGVPHYW